MAIGSRNITRTGQIGDGREAAAADYVVANARHGDIDDVIAKVDQFAYEKSFLINVGDEKGELFDAAVRRADPRLALELGTYCGYGSLRIARAAPSAEVVSVEHKTHGEYQTLVPDVVLGSESWVSRLGYCARGWAPAHTSRSAFTVTIV
jgi:hypothetical protein